MCYTVEHVMEAKLLISNVLCAIAGQESWTNEERSGAAEGRIKWEATVVWARESCLGKSVQRCRTRPNV